MKRADWFLRCIVGNFRDRTFQCAETLKMADSLDSALPTEHGSCSRHSLKTKVSCVCS